MANKQVDMDKKSNSHFMRLVQILNKGQYHRGSMLGKQLGVSRTAIWKLINKLKQYHVDVHCIKGKGYRLSSPLILLDEDIIQKKLQHQVEIDIFENINSTNDYLKSLVTAKMRICIAESQTQGKGRLNRYWHSPFAENIYLSCLYFLQKDISELAGLSLMVSLAVAKTLKNFLKTSAISVKWPNDVLCEKQKLSGSLIEVEAEAHGVCRVIIGIGINVNMLFDEGYITQQWTSLRKITNQYFDRNIICALLINQLLNDLKYFEQEGFAFFANEWKTFDALVHQEITLNYGSQQFSGEMIGVNPLGNLLLKLKSGIIKSFSSGETSMVKEGLV